MRLPLQFRLKTKHSRELTSNDKIRKFPSTKKQVNRARFKRSISQNADDRSLSRLTDDLEQLTELLKSREEKPQHVTVIDNSEKRANTAEGKVS